MSIIDEDFGLARIGSPPSDIIESNPVWCSAFWAAPASRKGEMFEGLYMREHSEGASIVPFDAGFKTTFDGYVKTLYTDKDFKQYLTLKKSEKLKYMWKFYSDTSVLMENKVHGPVRTNQVLVEIKCSNNANEWQMLNDRQRAFALAEHIRIVHANYEPIYRGPNPAAVVFTIQTVDYMPKGLKPW